MNNLSFDSIDDVHAFMGQIPMFSTRGIAAANFSLDSIRDFCREIGNPQERFKAIHIAGTNGKGTVCRMLASVYITCGYKTGLYTSPHLLSVRERFIVNGEMINDDELLRFFRQYGHKVKELKLTYFELTTAIAFWFFSEQKVDIAVIETGLGGRLDATNIITPLVSVITSIGKDHTDILGDTIEKITAEKAGIIKKGRPVVAGKLPADAQKVISDKANELGCKLAFWNEAKPERNEGKLYLQHRKLTIDFGRRPAVDTINCACAYLTAGFAADHLSFTDRKFKKGIEQMDDYFSLHAHFIKLHPDLNWYFDGSHNPDAIRTLVAQLQEIAPLNNWIMVLSMMRDKLCPEIPELLKEIGSLQLYALDSERAAEEKELTEYFEEGTLLKAADHLPEQWIKKHKSELVIFSGSFYFYSTVRRWMGAIAAK